MIVGFAGRAGSGKNAAAAATGLPAFAFADPLRAMLREMNPLVGESRLSDYLQALGWEGAKRANPEVRRLLQRLGMSARAEISPDVWVRALERRIEASGSLVAAISDVRFPNEVAWIQEHGGKVIWIERDVEHLDDPTENSVHAWDCDYTVVNDGSLAQLQKRVRVLLGA